ncbi:MAG: signal peptidase II [Candidatus Omnitrophica bacterium]|nr:signal peptidase II [Candidatus Omnitrophota bacterium]
MVFIIIIFVLLLDQLTKFLISKILSYGQSLPVIGGVFHLTLLGNRGAAFGILKNQTPFFIFASLLAISLIYFELRKKKHNISYEIALGLICSGTLGNLIDRIRFGYVIDFLDFRIWPVFNIADSAISIGAVLLGWSILTIKDNH